MKTTETQAPVSLKHVILILEHADAAMAAASAQLWDIHRDLALELNRRAARCRVAIQDIRRSAMTPPKTQHKTQN